MSGDSRRRKIYEKQIIKETLKRLSSSAGMEGTPLSRDEVVTLAKRHREAVYGSDRKIEHLAKYSAHLSKIYGDNVVLGISSRLVDINNEIAYEEK
jgi:hypothetical protein